MHLENSRQRNGLDSISVVFNISSIDAKDSKSRNSDCVTNKCDWREEAKIVIST